MIAMLAHAWWSAFVFASGAPLGALALRLIGRLTGGRWAGARPLVRLSALTPWLCLAVLPGLAATPMLFPGSPAGLDSWLAVPDHVARTAVALIGWSLISLGVNRFRGRLFAGLALVFHGVAVSLVCVDWIMAASPGWISSAGGMTLAVQQLAIALAVSLISLEAAADATPRQDIAGLLAAMLLANLYFALMTYVVPWYGDLAEKTVWFRLRAGLVWQVLLGAALVIGSTIPLGLLGGGRRRLGDAAGPLAAGAACIGLGLQSLWWSAPAPDAAALPLAGLFTAIAAAVLLALASGWRFTPPGRLAHAR
ncbi:MAG TPA: hypothetical protein VHZ26_00980 [Caulobacteraceae bacterium]|jgi:hypothetical protein|nr:hypothetical protein [Caulobacteraceae bacterium]